MAPLSNSGSFEYVLVPDEDKKLQAGNWTSLRAICKTSHAIYLFWLPWTMTILLAFVILILLVAQEGSNTLGSSWEAGWETDFGPAKAAIELEQIKFNGAPSFKDNGTMYIPNPDPINYLDGSTSELDQAWERLIWGRYFVISKSEAHAAWGANITEFWSPKAQGYTAGLDMFHTLHCLNKIRRGLDVERYPNDIRNPTHLGHCIEQMRQYIMCSGDLTPIPSTYYEGIHRDYVLSDQTHTCRNFVKIRQWVTDRFIAQPAYNESLP